MRLKYILVAMCATYFSSCQDIHQNSQDKTDTLSKSLFQKQTAKKDSTAKENLNTESEKEKSPFIYKYSLGDWFAFGAINGYFYPLKIIDKNNKDTISDVFLEYDNGVYLIRSYRLGYYYPIRLPLFYSEFHFDTPCSRSKLYKHLSYRYSKYMGLEIEGVNYNFLTDFKLVDEDNMTYKVIQKEFYEKDWETPTKLTGLRVFTISMVKGTIEYETKKEFDKQWY